MCCLQTRSPYKVSPLAIKRLDTHILEKGCSMFIQFSLSHTHIRAPMYVHAHVHACTHARTHAHTSKALPQPLIYTYIYHHGKTLPLSYTHIIIFYPAMCNTERIHCNILQLSNIFWNILFAMLPCNNDLDNHLQLCHIAPHFLLQWTNWLLTFESFWF